MAKYRIIKYGSLYGVQEWFAGEWLPDINSLDDWYATEEKAREAIKDIHSNNILFYEYDKEYKVEDGVTVV